MVELYAMTSLNNYPHIKTYTEIKCIGYLLYGSNFRHQLCKQTYVPNVGINTINQKQTNISVYQTV